MKKTRWILIASLALITFLAFTAPLLLNSVVAVPESLGTVRLNIETYRAGQNQPTHPSVVVFPDRWNGAKYWLAYSPYPYGNGEEENPCLAVSDDLYYWETPAGLANPIADNEDTGCDELKDPHLLYRDDLDRLEMWYLGRLAKNLGGDGISLLLFRKYSYDGINWSDYEIMATTQYLSPTIYWDGAKYQMWGIGYDLWNTTGTVVYQESTDGITWSAPHPCYIGIQAENIDIWHGTVTFFNEEYHLVYVDNSDKQEVYYCSSPDGIRFSEPKVIVENNGYWDFLYRPTLICSTDAVSCLYGVVNQENQWYISMSTGEDVNHLFGIDETLESKMYQLSDEIIDTHSIRYQIKELYHAIHAYFRPELLFLAVFEAVLFVWVKPLQRKTYILTFFTFVNCLLSFVYIAVRLQPVMYVSWIGAIFAVCCVNLCMSAVLKCVSATLVKEQ